MKVMKEIFSLIIILVLFTGCVAEKTDVKQVRENSKEKSETKEEKADEETEADEEIVTGVMGGPPQRIPIDIQDTSDELGIDFDNLEPGYDLRVERSTSYFPEGYRLVFLIYEDDNMNRLLDVVKQDKSGEYEKIVSNPNAILKCNEGGIWGDPFSSMEYSKDTLKLFFYGGSSWRWCREYCFRREGEQLKLYSAYHVFGNLADGDLGEKSLKRDGGRIDKANFYDGIIETESNIDGTVEKKVEETNEIIDIQDFNIYESVL